MTERQGDVRPALPDPPGRPKTGRLPEGQVLHKGTRDCPITQPHPAASCGIVLARRRRAAAMNARPDAGAV